MNKNKHYYKTWRPADKIQKAAKIFLWLVVVVYVAVGVWAGWQAFWIETGLAAELNKRYEITGGHREPDEVRIATVDTINATITAYTSEEEQTDSTPCISANNSDICDLYKKGVVACANNQFPVGTVFEVEGVGECILLDRMNRRFDNTFRIDYYMGYETKRAKQFGVQEKKVTVKKLPSL